jgi:hypothetical protein
MAGVGTTDSVLNIRVSVPARYGVSPILPVGFSGLAATVDRSE